VDAADIRQDLVLGSRTLIYDLVLITQLHLRVVTYFQEVTRKVYQLHQELQYITNRFDLMILTEEFA